MSERDKTMEILKENNREMEIILASLKVPRTDVITLEKTLTLKFKDLISQVTIVFLPQDLTLFNLEI